MTKHITKKTPMLHGHTRVEYSDGSQEIIQRGQPIPHTVEAKDAVDPKASEIPAEQRLATDEGAKVEDGGGAASGPGDGPHEEGKPSDEAQQD